MMDLYPDPKIDSKYMQSQPGIKKGTKIKMASARLDRSKNNWRSSLAS
jgi:hypothetical protein